MFDVVSLKCMLTWHTDCLENTNLALHFENVADPWHRGNPQNTRIPFPLGEGPWREKEINAFPCNVFLYVMCNNK